MLEKLKWLEKWCMDKMSDLILICRVIIVTVVMGFLAWVGLHWARGFVEIFGNLSLGDYLAYAAIAMVGYRLSKEWHKKTRFYGLWFYRGSIFIFVVLTCFFITSRLAQIFAEVKCSEFFRVGHYVLILVKGDDCVNHGSSLGFYWLEVVLVLIFAVGAYLVAEINFEVKVKESEEGVATNDAPNGNASTDDPKTGSSVKK